MFKRIKRINDNIKIQKGANLTKDINPLGKLINENNELISIFVVSIKTASSRLKK